MNRPPSNQRHYDEYWSGDDAFEQSAPDATPEQFADYSAKLTVAIDSGDWSALRVAGGPEPVKFVVKLIPTATFTRILDLQKEVGDNELAMLAFQAALVSVANLGNVKVVPENHDRLGRIASLSFFDDAGKGPAWGTRAVIEIGTRCLIRASTLSPKS
jgi:hypothetical protein